MSGATYIGLGLFFGLLIGGGLGWSIANEPAFGAVAGGLGGVAIGYMSDRLRNN